MACTGYGQIYRSAPGLLGSRTTKPRTLSAPAQQHSDVKDCTSSSDIKDYTFSSEAINVFTLSSQSAARSARSAGADNRAAIASRVGSDKSIQSNTSADSGYGGSQKKKKQSVKFAPPISKSNPNLTSRTNGYSTQCLGSCLCSVQTARQHVRAGIQSRFMVQMSMMRIR